MTKVYNYMGLGLLATALTAYIGRHGRLCRFAPLMKNLMLAPLAW